jgi:hypothetical protein
VLYGCEEWPLKLREECRLRVFENRILKRIFGPKRDTNGELKRLRNEELHNLYLSPNRVRVNKSTRLRWVGHVARMEEVRIAFKILTSTPTGKKPLGRPRRIWEDNIRIDPKGISINTRNWVGSTQDRDHCRAVVNATLNFRVL